MFGLSRRRSVVLIAVAGAGMAVGAVSATAAGGAPHTNSSHVVAAPNPPVRPHSLTAHAQPAVIATNVHCGQTVTASVTLNGDLFCNGPGLVVTGANINVNLGGHQVTSNTFQANVGIQLNGKTDTVQNGLVSDFQIGVEVFGTTDTVLNVRASNNYDGIYDTGAGTKVTTSTIASSANNGFTSTSSGATYSGVHELNNLYGLVVFGTKTLVTGNVANGNSFYGIYDGGVGSTLTKNVADANGGDGIRVADDLAIDGAGNTAKGNDYASTFTPIQCFGVVCS